MLLPDLTPWVSQNLGFVYDWTIQGNDLRLTTAAANIGAGRLELRGGETQGDEQTVYQRIYNANGTYTDVLAGVFVYHPEHGHIHFEDFASFSLRAVLANGGVGDVVATSDKVSFCLLDVERYDSSGPASPAFLTCGQVQGISVGWADVYDRGLPGQSIEITNLAEGDYWLEVVIDPANRLIESDETNNVARIRITLERPVGQTPIKPDTFESNNSFATASILAPPEDHVYDNLSIHASLNDDYYRITASASGILSFSLAFQHAQGDVDMEVYDSTQRLIGRSDSATDTEHFSLGTRAGEFYYVRVYGYEGATNPNYTFSVDQSEGGDVVLADAFENNDSFATATRIAASDQIYQGLTIEKTGDDDYYRFTASATGTLSLDLSFLNAQGDIDLEVFNASKTLLGRSDGATDNEHLNVAIVAGKDYFIKVFGYEGALSPDYTMTVDMVLPDRFENNDRFSSAKRLPGLDQTYTGLTIEKAGDDDYFRFTASETGTLSVDIDLLHAKGDLDIEIFDSSKHLLVRSDGATDNEHIDLSVVAGRDYFIRVYGYEGAISPDYALTLHTPHAFAGVTLAI